MDLLRDVLGTAQQLSPFGFFLRTILVGILLWAQGKVLPHRSGGQFAGYDFAFFWMMGGITVAPLFEKRLGLTKRFRMLPTILTSEEYGWVKF